MTRQVTSRCFRFGEFELDVPAYALRRGSECVKLEKIPMEVLILLVSRAGELVDRGTVEAALWGSDVHVDRDAAINTAVRKLRRALSDSTLTPRFVETVVGKGYRFISPVERRAGQSRPWASEPARGVESLHHRLLRGKQEFLLHPGENLLGRDPAADVHLEHPSVSRRHARISIQAAGATIEDVDSRNGTFLDGRRVDAPVELHDGAIIGLGPVTLVFGVLSSPASTRPMTGSVAAGANDPARS
jgi:DNA-binding winged helix-turn-helix (wHTH) protein